MDLVGSYIHNQVSLPCKRSQFLDDITRQTQFIYIDFNRASLNIFHRKRTFLAGSGSTKKYCFCFKPSRVKCPILQVISLGKLSSFTLISTQLPLIFYARSGPFWQNAQALEKYCFHFQPSNLGQAQFSQVGTLFLEKIFNFFDTSSDNLNYFQFFFLMQHEPKIT